MPETYFVDCSCGNQIQVELFHAGTDKTCPSCNSTVRVPSTDVLKELSGDKYPLLSPIEKVRQTAQNGEPPFNGMCHGCGTAKADYSTPCHLRVMVERQTKGNEGIRPTITGGVKLVAAEAEERWETTIFPILLCQQCQAQFESEESSNQTKGIFKSIALFAVLGAFLYFAYYNMEAVAALSGLICLVGAIAWALSKRDNKEAAPLASKWLRNIRWVPEAIEAEDEYHLSIGPSVAINGK